MSASESLLVRACRRQPTERTPIWVMRQAGRYLPEYNEVRSKTSFLGLCKTPELAAEVTLQPLRRFPLDAAIIFSDILVPVEAMGIGLDFAPGPKLDRTIATAHDVQSLRSPDPDRDMGFVMDAIRAFKGEKPDFPLLGFAGAPFTLAAYMIEGAGSKDFHPTKSFLYREPRPPESFCSASRTPSRLTSKRRFERARTPFSSSTPGRAFSPRATSWTSRSPSSRPSWSA